MAHRPPSPNLGGVLSKLIKALSMPYPVRSIDPPSIGPCRGPWLHVARPEFMMWPRYCLEIRLVQQRTGCSFQPPGVVVVTFVVYIYPDVAQTITTSNIRYIIFMYIYIYTVYIFICAIYPPDQKYYILYTYTQTQSAPSCLLTLGILNELGQALGPSNLWNARWTIEGKHGQGWVARRCLLDIFDMLARPETTETLVTSLTCLVFFLVEFILWFPLIYFGQKSPNLVKSV